MPNTGYSFDWDEIFSGHADWGRRAVQSSKKDVFEGLSEAQIIARVQAAWRERKLLKSQYDVDGVSRQLYEGVDPASGQIVRFWADPRDRVVETAYPQGFAE